LIKINTDVNGFLIRLSFRVAFIVLKPEDLAVKRLVVKQYDFLLGAALFLWQQLMALMGW
jgi:hypothetical protein